MVTGVREHGGRLYLGSLAERAVAVLGLPAQRSGYGVCSAGWVGP